MNVVAEQNGLSKLEIPDYKTLEETHLQTTKLKYIHNVGIYVGIGVGIILLVVLLGFCYFRYKGLIPKRSSKLKKVLYDVQKEQVEVKEVSDQSVKDHGTQILIEGQTCT